MQSQTTRRRTRSCLLRRSPVTEGRTALRAHLCGSLALLLPQQRTFHRLAGHRYLPKPRHRAKRAVPAPQLSKRPSGTPNIPQRARRHTSTTTMGQSDGANDRRRSASPRGGQSSNLSSASYVASRESCHHRDNSDHHFISVQADYARGSREDARHYF